MYTFIERFGDVNYDKRTTEYDDCEGVGEVIDKIRQGIDKGTKNKGNWKADSIVLQVPCEPVYDCDGKFYMSEAEAYNGSTSDEVKSPSDSGTLTNVTDKKEPGEHVTEKGKFKMSSTWSDDCFCLKKPGCSLQTRGTGSSNRTAVLWSKS